MILQGIGTVTQQNYVPERQAASSIVQNIGMVSFCYRNIDNVSYCDNIKGANT